VAVDVSTPGSPGWWMARLFKQLQGDLPRLRALEDYRQGRPPLVLGSQRLQSAFYRFQRQARSNFAELIVSAMTERMSVRSIRTAAANDDNGDQVAWRLWTANNLDVGSTDVHDDMGTYGWTYVAVAAPAADGEEPVVTIEDPRQVTTAQDPIRPDREVAAFKIFHDDVRDMDFVYLWLPGEKWVARRPRKARSQPITTARTALEGRPPLTPVSFSPRAFDLLPIGRSGADGRAVWDPEQPDGVLDPVLLGEDYDGPTSERYEVQDVPIVKFGNRRCTGEFELHTDLLDRINQTVLNKIVIVTLQAFKQRALETSTEAGEDGGLPDEDEDGNPIDYNQVFEADPGALWRLPIGAKIWESAEVNMQGILASARDDILHLAAVSRTPFPMFSPDSANQSANGASLYREGLTFKVEDRGKIAGRAWAKVVALGFKFKGDEQRGQVADVIVSWAPADRYSILEMAQADAQSTLPAAQKYARIYGMPPDEVAIAMAQRNQDAFMTNLGQSALRVPSTRAPQPQLQPAPDREPAPTPAGD
jgi:hypothetical protein